MAIMQFGLRSKIIISIVIITISAILLMGILSIKIIERDTLAGKIKDGKEIMKSIRFLYGEVGSVNIGKFISGRNDIEGLTIIGEDGRLIFNYGNVRHDGKERFYSPEIIKNIINKDRVIFLSGIPIGGKTASVKLSITLADVNLDIANTKRFILFYALLNSVIITIFGAFLVNKSIIKPIKKLDMTAREIADGNLDKKAMVPAGDEIGSLAGSFNAMTDKLKSSINMFERMNRELVAVQEEILRSEKLAAVGRLSAGVAHEIGNPLGAILGYIEILKRGGIDEREKKDILERLEKETSRINAIVKEFLDISRPTEKEGSRVRGQGAEYSDVNKIINESIKAVEFKGNFKVGLNLEDGLPFASIDANKLEQVIINILLNARDAMTDGGTVNIMTGLAVQLGTDFKSVPTKSGSRGFVKEPIRIRKDDTPDMDVLSFRKGKDIIVIKISDTGCGIKKEDIGKIFDPFFTTKEIGKGTGLGLTVSLGIIQAYGGDIKVESIEEKGATFEIIMPVAEVKNV